MNKLRWPCRLFFCLSALLTFHFSIAAQPAAKPGNRISTVIDDRFTVARPFDIHPLAKNEYDEGAAAADMRMERMVMLLTPDADQQKELEELAAAQQDPDSPEYHRWLTPEAYGGRFGVSEADLDQIVHWLEIHGFAVEPVAAARRSIVFSGSVAQVAAAFHTEIHAYTVNGKRHYANATAPEIPEALADVVQGIVSLHDFEAKPSTGNRHLTPAEFAALYDVAPLYTNSTDGGGQSIAIVGRSNIPVADVQTFRSRYGLPVNNPAVVVNGTDPGMAPASEDSAALLDVEWAGAVARKASIQLVVSASTNSSDGALLSAQYIVNHNLAPVISVGFSSSELALGSSGNRFWNSLWQQAAVEGMTIVVASGDGRAGNVNGLCSSPYSTCVGGSESGGVSGSGSSRMYSKPVWQMGSGDWRDVPDVALHADAASFSGLLALAAQRAAGRLGNVNPVLYTLAAQQASGGAVVFHDVTGDNGLGSVDAAQLIDHWGDGTTSAGAFQLSASAAPISVRPGAGASTVVQLRVSGRFDAAVALSVSDLPSGLTASFSPATLPAGSASSTLTLTAAPQATAGVRHVTITASGGRITRTVSLAVNTLSACTYAVSPSSAAAAAPSGTYSAMVTAMPGCAWTAVSNNSWITVGAGRSGNGIGNVIYFVTGNMGTAPRLGSITMAGVTFPVTQAAAAAQSVSLNPPYANIPAAAATGSVAVTASSSTATWTAVSNASWITIASGASRTGSKSVGYAVSANTGTDRTGTITLAGLTFRVMQAGAPAGFKLSANPSFITVKAGGSATASIRVTGTGGFQGNVRLAVTGLPGAVKAVFLPMAVVAPGSTAALQLTAGPLAHAFSAMVTVTGASGNLIATTPLNLTVTPAPGFNLSANPSFITVKAGGSATTSISVTGTGGFQGNVSLAVTGLPGAVKAVFIPMAVVAPGSTATLKLTAGPLAHAFSAMVTVTGACGNLIATTPLNLSVTPAPAGFKLSANPSSLAIKAGSSATATISVTGTGGFQGNVRLAVTGLPGAVKAVFIPMAVVAPGSTATLQLTAGPLAHAFSAMVTVTGVSGNLIETTPLNMTVTPAPGFRLSTNPSSITVKAGSSATTSISVTGTGGFQGNVSLAVTGLPGAVKAVFIPGSVVSPEGMATLQLTAGPLAHAFSAMVTVTGASGNLIETTPLNLTVTPAPAGFKLSANPPFITVKAGGSAITSISVTGTGGFQGNVRLAVTGLPGAVRAVFLPMAVVAPGSTATLQLTAGPLAHAFSAMVTVTGASGDLIGSTPLNLTVTPAPGFNLSAHPSFVTVKAGGSATTSISVTGTGGFLGNVSLAVTGLPGAVRAVFIPMAVVAPGSTATLQLTAGPLAHAFSAMVTVTGASGNLIATAPLNLSVTPAPEFTLGAGPSAMTVSPGSFATSTISVVRAGDFEGSVTLFVTGLPPGVTAEFIPMAVVAPGTTATLKLTAGPSARVFSGTVTVMGTSGSVTVTTPLSLSVTSNRAQVLLVSRPT